jgi:ribonuclease BN (tRNA processing enzyme)
MEAQQMSFEILMNGVGDAFSTLHFGTNFLLRRGDFVLAIDCPDSYRRALDVNDFRHGEGSLEVGDIDAMIITHLHGDHVNGLEMVAAYRSFALGRPLTIHTSAEVASVLWEKRLEASLGTMWDGTCHRATSPEEFYALEPMPWNSKVTIGPFEVETRRTLHHIPTMALRFSDGHHTLGYSCDTAYDPELIAWLEPCDVILHESTHGKGHTPLEKLLALPESVRRKLYIVHYPDDLSGADIDGLRLASEGEVYRVG